MSTDQVREQQLVEHPEANVLEHGVVLRVTRGSPGEAVMTTDAAGRVTFLNALAESLTGWTCPEAKGQPWDAVLRIVNDASQRRLERAVADARTYADDIVATVREPLLVLDAELRVRMANRAFYHEFRVTPADTEGRLLYDLGDGQWSIPALRTLLEEILLQNTSFHDFEVQHPFQVLGCRTMLLNARRVLGDGVHRGMILLAIEDITERKRAAEALREADRRKDEFLAMLAHELRNPLAPLRNAVQIMRLKGTDDPDVRWARDVVERQLQQLTRLVDDLLDVARCSCGKINLQTEPVDMAAVVARAVEISRPLIDARKHYLEVSLPEQAARVEGDPTRLAQVLSNLLNNAAKYTEEGGRIDLTLEPSGGEAVLRVRDTGVGIAADMLSNIFEMFTQVQGSVCRSQGGLGIGLTLVRKLVEMHGGRVVAHSEGPGRGSEFVVRLPLLGEATPLAAR